MGKQKLLLPWKGDTILGHTLANARASGINPLTVICGAEADVVTAEVEAKGLPWLINKDFAEGQSTSLICGLKTAPHGFGVMFILGDMPVVQPQSYVALAAAYTKSAALIVVPINVEGKRGNPTVWSPELFAEIKLLYGDTGGRELMTNYRGQTLLIPIDDPGLYRDIDTPEEYERLKDSEVFH
jgi:molybdenum cofactor cytidylyltransferase